MKREIEDVCNSDFTLPQVVVRLRFFLHKIESMFPHSQQLSDDCHYFRKSSWRIDKLQANRVKCE